MYVRMYIPMYYYFIIPRTYLTVFNGAVLSLAQFKFRFGKYAGSLSILF